jgi:hypothetical protein
MVEKLSCDSFLIRVPLAGLRIRGSEYVELLGVEDRGFRDF